MNTNPLSAWQLGRRFAFGAVIVVLGLTAADRRMAASIAQQGQATAARPETQKPNQPRVPWWKDPAVIKEIRLTPEQSAKIDEIWRKRETEMHSAAKEYERQRHELDRLMAERKVGVDVIGVQHDRVEAQRTTLAKSRAIALYQTSLVLSADQNTALKKIGERNRRDRR